MNIAKKLEGFKIKEVNTLLNKLKSTKNLDMRMEICDEIIDELLDNDIDIDDIEDEIKTLITN